MSGAEPDLNQWWAEYGGEYAARSWRDYRHLLAEAIQHAPGPPLRDVGWGFGFLVECARQFGVESIGVEASTVALAESRRRHPEADTRSWRAGSPLPCADGSIGVAVLNQVVDHVTPEENRLL